MVEGKQTCADESHQEVEHIYVLWGQSHVQLQEKLKRQRVSHPNDRIAQDIPASDLINEVEEEEFEVDIQDSDHPDMIHGIHEGVSDP